MDQHELLQKAERCLPGACLGMMSLPPDLRQITATITAQPSEAVLIALLERIEQAPHLIVVDRLNVRQQPDPSLEMVLVAYARIGAKIAGKRGSPALTPAPGEPQ